MYAVGVSGSPRKNGNTSILVNEVLRFIDGEKRLISLADLDIHPCRDCGGCYEENTGCVIDDDIPWVIRELEKCDVILLGSPCYFKSVSAQLKMLIDRTVSVYEMEPFRNKIGAAVVTQDVYGKGRGGELVLRTLIDFFNSEGMIYAGGVIGEGGAEMGNVRKDKRAMKEAKKVAKRINELYGKMNGR